MTKSTLNLVALTLSEKKALLVELRAAIKSDTIMIKEFKINQKAVKEAAKKEKIQNAIKAAQDKLAKLQAKLAV